MMHIPYDKMLNRQFDFKVEYKIYSAEEGGRIAPMYQGYRSDFRYSETQSNNFNTYMIWPEFEYENGEVITDEYEPISNVGIARMWIIGNGMKHFHMNRIKIGTIGYMVEGNRKVGECKVIHVNI